MIKEDTTLPGIPAADATPGAVPVLRVDHVGIMVPELDPAIDWYVSAFGLAVVDRWEDDASGMAWAHLDAGSLRLEIVQRPGLSQPTAGASGIHHIAVVVDDCATATDALVRAGGEVVIAPSHFDRHAMDWSFVRDPFGNILEIVSYPPQSVPDDQGGADRR